MKMKKLLSLFVLCSASFLVTDLAAQTQCGDGTYSSSSGRGTCSHHGGVASGTPSQSSPSTPKSDTSKPSTPQQDKPARTKRSESAKHEFQRQHPCPSTGKTSGECPGYVVDHVNPLACGGADDPSNMQWQSQAEAKEKDKWERKGCSKADQK